jgi:hypothetical protein
MELKNEKFFCDPCTEKLKGKGLRYIICFFIQHIPRPCTRSCTSSLGYINILFYEPNWSLGTMCLSYLPFSNHPFITLRDRIIGRNCLDRLHYVRMAFAWLAEHPCGTFNRRERVGVQREILRICSFWGPASQCVLDEKLLPHRELHHYASWRLEYSNLRPLYWSLIRYKHHIDTLFFISPFFMCPCLPLTLHIKPACLCTNSQCERRPILEERDTFRPHFR